MASDQQCGDKQPELTTTTVQLKTWVAVRSRRDATAICRPTLKQCLKTTEEGAIQNAMRYGDIEHYFSNVQTFYRNIETGVRLQNELLGSVLGTANARDLPIKNNTWTSANL